MEEQTAGAGPSHPTPPNDTLESTRPQHVQLSPVSEFRPPRNHDGEGELRPDIPGRLRSRVSMDFFDPKGVRKLSRALSRVSDGEQSTEQRPEEVGEDESEISEETMKPSDDQFDFEKAVRIYLRK